LALGYGWGHAGAKTATEEPEEKGPIATVKVAAMEKGRLEVRSSAFGSIVAAPGAARTLSVAYECRLASLFVSEGQVVTPGEALATVTDSADALLALDQARIDATSTEAQLAQARNRHDLKLADNATLAQAQQAAASAKARVASLEARQMGTLRVLRSKAPGVVVRLPAQVGAVVPAGSSLLELADLSRLEARLGTDPQAASRLRPGGALTLAPVDGREAVGTPARIRTVSPAINPITRMRDVFVALPPGHPFLYGQYVRGSLLAAPSDGVLVPYAAVLPQDGRNILFTIRNGRAVRHEVQVLAQSGDRLELAGEGLDPKEPAVVQGNYQLQDGMAVQVEGPVQ
jgi:RND family efflux transporter MFP subunit